MPTSEEKLRRKALEKVLANASGNARMEILKAVQSQAPLKQIKLQEWLEETSPGLNWRWPYIRYIIQHLQDAVDGRIPKLMIFAPPRHGKSELTTRHLPAYCIERNPSFRVIVAAYNQELANGFSRAIRRRCIARGVKISKDERSVTLWRTIYGGGLRAVGVGGGIAGFGGHLLLIDDPVKNREEVSSLSYRDKMWEWYKSDFLTRGEPGGSMILIMTRWHEDDLAGRILRSPQGKDWVVINLPALAEESDPLGREPGEALNPERFSAEDLNKIKEVQGRNFWGLYQGRPQEQEGDMFKRSWFTFVDEVPTGSNIHYCRYWDKAGTKDGGTHTAGVLLALDSKKRHYTICDLILGQWNAAEREDIIKSTAHLDRDMYGHVEIGVEQEGGSGGKESAENTVKNLDGFPVFLDFPKGNKTLRAEPISSQARIGNVSLVHGEWNDAMMDSLTSFPGSIIKDPVDALSGAHAHLSDLVVDWGALMKLGIGRSELDPASRWR